MAEQDTQSSKEAQKTVVAFIAGLVIGGLLVFAFGGNAPEDASLADDERDTTEVTDTDERDEDESADEGTDDASDDASDDEDAPSNTIETGDATARASDQAAGSVVVIDSAIFPNDEGWIGVREYEDGETGSILGVARYSKSQALTPSQVKLLRGTTAGNEYAIVFFTDNGDRQFSASVDTQVGGAADTFRAE